FTSTRRGFLKMAALGGGFPAIAGDPEGRDLDRTLEPRIPASAHLADVPSAAAGKVGQHLDRASLATAVAAACDWITGVAQMKADSLSNEHNSRKLEHQHWRGALRGEYRVSTRQWDFFCPVWHTGQAIKALVWASQALSRPDLLDAARLSAGFI